MILYSRNDCPLCEDVEETLVRLNIAFSFVDIDEDETLRKKYHVTVPVLQNNKQQELFWPFDDVRLLEFSKQ